MAGLTAAPGRAMTSDALREAAATCERAFAFLVDEFGYRLGDRHFGSGGFALRYHGPVLGVLVDWYPRDPLTVWLVRLVDGRFPDRPVTIYPDTPLHYFELGDIEAASGYRRRIPELDLYRMPNQQTAGALADSVRECATDLLRGDLDRIPLLEQRIRERTRQITVSRLGPEAARALGW
jgi:hypothetical protein